MGIALTDLARLGWMLQAFGALAWSIVLVPQRGLERVVGAIGVVSAGLVVAAVASSGMDMSMMVLLGIMAAQAIWNLAAAALLVRRLPAPANEAALTGGVGLPAGA
jgi:hypothetical protein